MSVRLSLAVLCTLLLVACGGGDDGAEPAASFASPADGDTVTSPVTVEFAAEGVEVAEAGEVVEGEGHFHLHVNTPCTADGETIPGDRDDVMHYGDASTSDQLDLEPGEHTLCVQLGDGAHTAFGATETITITVE